jgi:hypothetical protein
MEPTGLVYVALTLNGLLLVAPEPVTMEQCVAMQQQYTTTMCVEKEPDCGKASGNAPCLGQADWEERANTVKPKKRVMRRRVVRR